MNDNAIHVLHTSQGIHESLLDVMLNMFESFSTKNCLLHTINMCMFVFHRFEWRMETSEILIFTKKNEQNNTNYMKLDCNEKLSFEFSVKCEFLYFHLAKRQKYIF